jgi:hypothetical protein
MIAVPLVVSSRMPSPFWPPMLPLILLIVMAVPAWMPRAAPSIPPVFWTEPVLAVPNSIAAMVVLFGVLENAVIWPPFCMVVLLAARIADASLLLIVPPSKLPTKIVAMLPAPLKFSATPLVDRMVPPKLSMTTVPEPMSEPIWMASFAAVSTESDVLLLKEKLRGAPLPEVTMPIVPLVAVIVPELEMTAASVSTPVRSHVIGVSAVSAPVAAMVPVSPPWMV